MSPIFVCLSCKRSVRVCRMKAQVAETSTPGDCSVHDSRLYIAKHLLKIADWGGDEAQQAVIDFFLSGKYNCQDILAEDYETFRQRLISHYEEYGNLDL